MDGSSNISFAVWGAGGIVLAALLSYFIFVLMSLSNTSPSLVRQGFTGSVKEGFGAVVGAGEPNCMRDSSEASALVAIFEGRVESVEEANPDLEELKVLLGKLCCMKRDLTAVSSVVNATLYSPFATAHDVEPVAETVGRCFAKTIPKRDLELSFDKWKARGRLLLTRLCAAAEMDGSEKKKVNGLFDSVLVDVFDITNQKCFAAVAAPGPDGPRDVKDYTPPSLNDLKPYTGYY
jgi:hypothetical protein